MPIMKYLFHTATVERERGRDKGEAASFAFFLAITKET